GLELERQELMMQGWQVVKRNIEKVQELVMDLLNYAGKREPELEQCDPNEVVLDVLELMKDRAEEYAVEIDFERGNFSYHPFLDRKLINRSLANLITNAIDACSEPLTLGRRGRVVVRTQEGPSGEVCFCVSDNGCGMEEDIRRKIFHCFFTTKGSRGTGLGLMLTHKMVLEHGGYMEVDSRAGEGSTFRIILPAIRKPHVQEIKERDESRPEDRGLRFG
ncbi:MAG: HAMP domain-containing sensor histidine kinase, partial [Candidatus Bathyarchaeia archaeon]